MRVLRDGFTTCVLAIALVPLIVGSRRGFAATPAYARQDPTYVFVGNDTLELTIQKSDGRLYSLVHRPSGYDFLARKDAYWGPLHFWATVNGVRENVFGGIAVSFTYSLTNTATGAVVTLVWDKFRLSAGRVLDATATLSIEVRNDDPLSYWNVSIANRENVVIDRVDCPDLHGITQVSANASQDYLSYPAFSGLLFRDPLHNFTVGRGYSFSYPAANSTMQFMAYYGLARSAGLYVAAYDADANNKSLSMSRPTSDWMSFSISHVLPFVAHRDYRPNFSLAVGAFSGDWYDAARLYRNWAVGQPWAASNRLAERSWTPEWFKRLSLHEWLFTYPNGFDINHFSLVPDIARDTAAQMGAPVAIDWIGWERNGWYIDYPDVAPPKEGWTSFENTFSALHAGGNGAMLIPDTTSYSTRLTSWPAAQPFAVTTSGVTGGVSGWTYSEAGQTTTFQAMCPNTSYWRQVINDGLTNMIARGADIIQLDGFPVFGPQACVATNHGHEPGGGNWWSSAYLDIFRGIKATAARAGRAIVFSSEGMAEPYLSLLDGFWDPYTTGWSPASLTGTYQNTSDVQLIPLWHAVYHDYGLLQSGIAFVSSFAPTGAEGYGAYRPYYQRGFALALVWGEIPTTWYSDQKISALTSQSDREMAEYLRRIVQARASYASDFLVYGQMLRPLALQVPTTPISGAKSIPYSGTDSPAFDSPSILGSVWRAPNGDVGFVLTNISPNPVAFELPIDTGSTELAAGGGYAGALTVNGVVKVSVDNIALPIRPTLGLDPRDVALITIGRKPRATLTSHAASDFLHQAAISSGGAFGGHAASPIVTTSDGVRLSLDVVADNLDAPSDLAFTPDGRLFIAERAGRVRAVSHGRLQPQAALTLTDVATAGHGGLLSLAVDPEFARNHFVFALYTTQSRAGSLAFRLARFREASGTLADRAVLLDDVPASLDHTAASMRFGADGKLYVALDDGGDERLAGDMSSFSGKILRMNADGSTPRDQDAATPVYSSRYRSPRGFGWQPAARTLWLADVPAQGPARLIAVAADQDGRRSGTVLATHDLAPADVPSSIAFYQGDLIPAFHDNLLVASDDGRHLLRVRFDARVPSRIVATERLLQDRVGDIRVIGIGPDGAIYFGTSNAVGRLVPE